MTNQPEKLYDNKTVRRKTRRAFLFFGLAILAGLGGFYWLIHQPEENGIGWPFRKVLSANEKLNHALYSNSREAKAYPATEAAKKARVNGDLGLGSTLNPDDWKLKVADFRNGNHDTLVFTLADIKKLPKTEVIFDFKCIEGWSQVSHWGGVRLSDFLEYYKLATHSGKGVSAGDKGDLPGYMGLQTPDRKYYVGIDMPSALHPQTLLCYELNGKPLPLDQGAPLRLIIPVKYGVKHLKRIGTMFFSDTPPADYWHEQGYDYDAAL